MQEEQIIGLASYESGGSPDPDMNTSGTSWAAIFAGAAAAAALSLILLILGVGLGLSAVSPWSSSGASAAAIGISTIVWLAFTQIIASAMGGYLAGRLRVKWADVNRDEVYFRDTAHGMLSWAVATLVTAAFLGSALTGIIGGGAKMAGSAAAGAATAATAGMASAAGDGQAAEGQLDYFIDTLFRSDAAPGGEEGDARGEAATIFLSSLRSGSLEPEDKTYLSKLVAQRSGLSQAEAEQRVTDVFGKTAKTMQDLQASAREAADAARKAAAQTALWTFVALLCGAFFASLAAVYGGRQRDVVGAAGDSW
ncbi:hypothetical protein [Pollutimonas bauzanensis]|uniref:Uncharacterized protein n=1 Tax=Pollutimonas bauzanensis TaxID=658167 RepID=A0A1M5W8V8_9BURK|nr:hypothetical protein [Pollutimonas bauzanensis]SHH83623.1 hypothetical protein SAMN04488135_105129 [Pollutimonas bauzanensis]